MSVRCIRGFCRHSRWDHNGGRGVKIVLQLYSIRGSTRWGFDPRHLRPSIQRWAWKGLRGDSVYRRKRVHHGPNQAKHFQTHPAREFSPRNDSYQPPWTYPQVSSLLPTSFWFAVVATPRSGARVVWGAMMRFRIRPPPGAVSWGFALAAYKSQDTEELRSIRVGLPITNGDGHRDVGGFVTARNTHDMRSVDGCNDHFLFTAWCPSDTVYYSCGVEGMGTIPVLKLEGFPSYSASPPVPASSGLLESSSLGYAISSYRA